MKYYAPDYYLDFKCKADKCRHSCCIGWEIDIDSDTLSYYKTIDGQIGKLLNKNISTDDEPHFLLGKDERCPFLNKNGLCDLILKLGEDSLCNICTDHPRFRAFYSDAEEIGLGLCCEEAGEIILKRKEPFKIIELNAENAGFSDEEEFVLNIREKLISIMQQRDKSIQERHSQILNQFGLNMPKPDIDFYLSLERLDPKWTDILNDLKIEYIKDIYQDLGADFNIAFEQLTCYFLYRHMPTAIWDNDLSSKVLFAVMGCQLISALATHHKLKYGNVTVDDLIEYARMYSAEIEYSEENTEALFNL